MKYVLSLALIFSLCTAFGQKKLTQLWESKEQLPVPESVLYVPERSELFVTLIDGDGSTADGKGGVAILNLDGTMKNATWIEGLNAPKGMALYRDQLYIADINEVVVVDIITGNVINQIKIPESKFLNDVTVDRAGKVYISDTRDGKIYQLHNNRPSLFMSNVPNVNGLRVIDGSLYAMAGPELGEELGGLQSIPVSILIDQDGKTRYGAVGFDPKDRPKDKFGRMVRHLLKIKE